MATAQPNDQFLVNRGGKSYNVTQANLMAEIQDTDLMLVNRDDISYKITGAEVKDSFVDPIVINGITLTTLDPKVGEEISVIVSATGGKSPVKTYQWRRDTVNITLNGTSVTYLPVEADLGASLDCVVTITDTVAETVTATSDSTNAVKPDETVNAPTLLTPPNGAGIGPETVTPTTDSISSVSTSDTTTTVVASGTKDLNLLEEGSATMTDASGAVVDYTPVTSDITTIEGGSTVFTVTNWGSPGNALDGSTLTQASSMNLGGNSSAFGVIDFGGTINITKFEYYGRIYTADNAYQLLNATGVVVHNLTNAAEDRNYGWQTVYDGPAISASSYRAHVYVDSLTQYTSDDIYAIKINDEVIACTDIVTVSESQATGNNTAAETILTLTDNQDLTYFQPGDNVQGVDSATTASANYSEWGQSYASAGAAVTISTGNTYQITPTQTYWFTAASATKPIVIKWVSGDNLYIVGTNNSATTSDTGTVLWNDYGEFELPFNQYDYIDVYAGGNGSGTFEITAGAAVVAVDVANSTMTVSGGDWATYNSSQTWSSFQGGTAPTANFELTKAFDGDPETQGGVVSGSSWNWTWTASFEVPNGSTLHGKLNLGDGDRSLQIDIDVDGVTTTIREMSPGPGYINDIDLYTNTTGSTVTLSNLKFTNQGSTSQTGVATIYWIAINDRIFVDNVPTSGPVVGEGKVTGPAITGTGRVSTVNESSKTITVTDSNKRWVSSGAWNTSTLQGNAAGSSFYLAGDEVHTVQVNGSDFNMTCTEFSGSGDPVYGTTTWQVTTDADTAFANPVVNVTNTNETLYNVTTLAADALYRARVRQTSTEGTESHFSDVNRFKTTAPVSADQIVTNTYTGGDTVPLTVGDGSGFTVGDAVSLTTTYTPETSAITTINEDGSGLVNVSATMAWAGYADNWPVGQTWSSMSASSDFGNTTGTLGTGGTETISTPFTYQADSFGSNIRGSNGWAIRFPSVVTLSFLPASGITQITATQTDDEALSAGITKSTYNVTTQAYNSVVLTGKVFWYQSTLEFAPSIAGLGTITSGGAELTFADATDLKYFQPEDILQNSAPAEVVSTDIANNKMRVSGGNWTTTSGGSNVNTVVWSNYWTSLAGGTAQYAGNQYLGVKAFNGIYSVDGSQDTQAGTAEPQYTAPDVNTGILWTPPSPISVSTKVQLKVYIDPSPSAPSEIIINRGESDEITITSNTSNIPLAQTFTYTFTPGSGNLVNIALVSNSGNAYAYMAAVIVDGVTLIDSENNNYNWSEPPIFDNNNFAAYDFYPTISPQQPFNGRIGTTYGESALPVQGGTWTWDFGNAFTVAEDVEVIYSSGSTAPFALVVNGTPQTLAAAPNQSITIPSITLQSLSIKYSETDAAQYCYLHAIKVGGKLLVDKDLIQNKVSTLSSKRGAGTVATVSGNALTINPWTDNAFVVGRELEVDGELFFDKNTNSLITASELGRTYGLLPRSDKARGICSLTDLRYFRNGTIRSY